jgi:hypothetical protein
MKTLNAFQEFYRNELSATLQELHLESRELLKKEAQAPSKNPKLRKLRRGIILISIPIVFILLFTIPFLIIFYVAACYMIVKIGGRMGVSELGEFREKYKNQIIRKILSFFEYDFEYQPFESVTKEQVNDSLIFPQFAPGLIGEDYVKGEIDKTSFEFSEVFALTSKEPKVIQLFASEEQQKKNMLKMMTEFNSLIAKSSNPFFRGLFFVADFHKDFACTTVVRPQDYKWGIPQFQNVEGMPPSPRYKVSDRLKIENSESRENSKLEQVNLEDPEFDEIFKVYSNDQVLSRYVLSTGMMQRIKDFRAKTGKEVFLSFKDSYMYLSIPYERPLLEPKGITKEHFSDYLKPNKETAAVLNEELVDDNHINEFFTDLHFIFSIVEDFNLNTRIWMKK